MVKDYDSEYTNFGGFGLGKITIDKIDKNYCNDLYESSKKLNDAIKEKKGEGNRYWKLHLYIKQSFKEKYLNKEPKHDRLEEVINVYKFICQNLPEDRKFTNFSNYNEGRLTIRFEGEFSEEDFEDLILKYIESCEDFGNLPDLVDWQLASVKQHDFVKAGHELATELSLGIFNNLITSRELKGNKQLVFLIRFTHELMKKMCGNSPFVWDELRYYENNPQIKVQIKDIIDSIDWKKYVDYINDPSFLERALHLLMNCLFLQHNIKDFYFGKISLEAKFWYLFGRGTALHSVIDLVYTQSLKSILKQNESK